MNKEDFVTYEQAIALKKLGFRDKCLYHYNIFNELVPNQFNAEDETITVEDLYDSLNTDTKSKIVCDVPTLAQAQKWLMKEKNCFVHPGFILKHHWNFTIFDVIEAEPIFCSHIMYSSYEEALSAGIIECLKLLENG